MILQQRFGDMLINLSMCNHHRYFLLGSTIAIGFKCSLCQFKFSLPKTCFGFFCTGLARTYQLVYFLPNLEPPLCCAACRQAANPFSIHPEKI